VGLRQGGKCLLTPRPHSTAPSCTLGNQVFVLRTALLFVRSAVRLASAELPGPVAVCVPKQALRELGDRVPGGDRIVEHRRVQRAPPPPPLTAPPATPATVYPARPKAHPGTRHRQWAGWYGSGSPRIITVSWRDILQASSICRDEIAAAARRDNAALRS
jgi:hypothetical protein